MRTAVTPSSTAHRLDTTTGTPALRNADVRPSTPSPLVRRPPAVSHPASTAIWYGRWARAISHARSTVSPRGTTLAALAREGSVVPGSSRKPDCHGDASLTLA